MADPDRKVKVPVRAAPVPTLSRKISRSHADFDATVARFATFFLALLASAGASPGTAFGVARLLVRSGAASVVCLAGAVVHGSPEPVTSTTSGGATAAAAGGSSLSVGAESALDDGELGEA
ncbi:hypothetical protein PF005_g32319 [Phytophthora fragariae]|uniref:Uncharacterized protein n=1 Tax=Phytophthora fragariae TaxID=53985 RepID=A0A6A3V4T1_9STRA|nr:hypothetical protein PF005_g32319 [Phytophthora fragariae]